MSLARHVEVLILDFDQGGAPTSGLTAASQSETTLGKVLRFWGASEVATGTLFP
jgi:hypothetical protein